MEGEEQDVDYHEKTYSVAHEHEMVTEIKVAVSASAGENQS